jgi:hypothetical protein
MKRTIGLALVFVSLVAAPALYAQKFSEWSPPQHLAAPVNEQNPAELSTLSEIPSQNDCRVIAAKVAVETPMYSVFRFESTDGAYVIVSKEEFEMFNVGDTYCGNWAPDRSR